MKLENSICDICNNEGWLKTSVYGSIRINDGTCVIEKCDDCNIFIDDFYAAKYVLESFNIYSFENENRFNVIVDC